MRFPIALAILVSFSPASAQVGQKSWEDIGRDFGALVSRKGFVCPDGKLAVPKGRDHYGDVYQVFCGDKGKSFTGSDVKLVFRLTFRPDKSYLVSPWVFD